MKKDKELFRSWTIIDLDNFRYNVEQLKSHMASDTLYMQIVKADAYGHGSIEIAREAEKLGVQWLGVANSDKGYCSDWKILTRESLCSALHLKARLKPLLLMTLLHPFLT